MALITQATIGRLFICQALYWCCSMIGITLTALIGLQLAPLNILATLPLALLVLGNLLAVQPLSLYMQRHGRRAGLLLGAGSGVLGGLISAWGVWLGDFSILCLGALPIGAYQASAMYYRFAALEAVPESARGRASAYVIGGGVIAALIAPSLALWSKNALDTPFTGAYLMMAALALVAAGVLSQLPQGAIPTASTGGWAVMRELLGRPVVRAAIATTAIGHGLMILVMNATPLAMRDCGLSLETSARVMQWHMLGMFLPAFVAGRLVDTLGSRRVAVIGSGVLLVSASIAMSGIARNQFLISSFLLGLGWNLMLIAGTTLLAQGHTPAERGHAQGLMELSNGSVAASASFASGALISAIGWNAVNISILPLIVIVLFMLIPGKRTQLA
ncbi:MFS transporter [Pseudomonas segetis]|uniref:Predicted arabinose efflux permease, MFS family n=1 Tax=Pseudomonas segetis TaxID=298908 RepID=A0A239AJ49_9PSED|nr:MFS transporter [Pseudomonas segetis]SNR94953.1 Predicted arabinose efflux permease, MFS family [Pseudomonas segetis]